MNSLKRSLVMEVQLIDGYVHVTVNADGDLNLSTDDVNADANYIYSANLRLSEGRIVLVHVFSGVITRGRLGLFLSSLQNTYLEFLGDTPIEYGSSKIEFLSVISNRSPMIKVPIIKLESLKVGF